jgi:hypothetical protein
MYLVGTRGIQAFNREPFRATVVAGVQVSPLPDTETVMLGREDMAAMSMVRRDTSIRLARVRLNVPVGIPEGLETEKRVDPELMASTVPLEAVKEVELTRTWLGSRRSRKVAAAVSARMVAVV